MSWQESSSTDCGLIGTRVLHMYLIFLKPAGYLGVVLAIMAEIQTSKLRNDNTFYISICSTLAKIPLVKVSHMLSPKSRDREACSSPVGRNAKSQDTRYIYKEGKTLRRIIQYATFLFKNAQAQSVILANISILKYVICIGVDKKHENPWNSCW